MTQPRFFAGLAGLIPLVAALACGGLTPSAQSPASAAAAAAPDVATTAPGKIPNLTIQLAWGGSPITLPAPINPEQTIYHTPQYRRWQYGGSNEDLTYVDPSGVKYVVKSAGSGSGKTKKGKSVSAVRGVRKMIFSRYRAVSPALKITTPTLENVTTYDHQGRLESWITFGPDGASRQVRVQMRDHAFCPDGVPLIQYICIYEPDRIRQLQINAQNVAWQEVETGESGNIRKRLHEDISKADKLQLMKR